jgi:hypothetical protein
LVYDKCSYSLKNVKQIVSALFGGFLNGLLVLIRLIAVAYSKM